MNIHESIADAVNQYNERYIRANGSDDFGTCGMAIVLISFGRKRKEKQRFMDAGLISESDTWSSASSKTYVIRATVTSIGTQNIDYYEGQARAIKAAVESFMEPAEGVDIWVHSWVD